MTEKEGSMSDLTDLELEELHYRASCLELTERRYREKLDMARHKKHSAEEFWQRSTAEYDAAFAAYEKVKAQHSEAQAKLTGFKPQVLAADIEEMRSEIKRLRNALASISVNEYESTSSATEKVHGNARIARIALYGEK
jgi:hypothetical protein